MEMNDPQVWTLIGVFAAVMLGGMTIISRQNDKVITSLRYEMVARFEALDDKFDAKIDAMDTKMNARLDTIDRRLEELDKEVANLATKFWRSS